MDYILRKDDNMTVIRGLGVGISSKNPETITPNVNSQVHNLIAQYTWKHGTSNIHFLYQM